MIFNALQGPHIKFFLVRLSTTVKLVKFIMVRSFCYSLYLYVHVCIYMFLYVCICIFCCICIYMYHYISTVYESICIYTYMYLDIWGPCRAFFFFLIKSLGLKYITYMGRFYVLRFTYFWVPPTLCVDTYRYI